jgi:hypothetical protein
MGKSEVKESFMPSVQHVGQARDPTEPGGGGSPRFIIDRIVTGMVIKVIQWLVRPIKIIL